MGTGPVHSVSVAGVVVNPRGEVLLIQRQDNQRWEPPGGVLELDETFEAGLQREVVEETGLRVAIDRLTGVYKNMPRGIVALVYRCRPLTTELATSDETADLRWTRPEDVPRLMAPAYAIRIADALADTPSSRAHDGTNLLASLPPVAAVQPA